MKYRLLIISFMGFVTYCQSTDLAGDPIALEITVREGKTELADDTFTAKLPNVPVRGRFSPMLFRGTGFSTGGYSAEY